MNTDDTKKIVEHDDIVADKINPLPRSIVRRTPFELLDGAWRFELDINNSGLDEHWYVHHEYTETAMFPGSIESHLYAAKDIKEESSLYKHSDDVVAWYERDFSVPESW